MLYATLPLSASTFSFAELAPLSRLELLWLPVSPRSLSVLSVVWALELPCSLTRTVTAGADSILYASPQLELRRCRVLAQSHA